MIGIVIWLYGAAAFAGTIDFTFEFTDLANGGNVVTGIIRGLSEGVSSATSVEVLSNTGGYGIGEYAMNWSPTPPGTPNENLFTVFQGMITQVSFVSFGVNNLPPDVTDSLLVLATFNNVTLYGGLSPFPNGGTSSTRSLVTYTVVPVAVPEPATFPLLLLGMAVLGLTRYRRQERARS